MKNILITGASGGIGSAVSLRLSSPGTRLLLVGNRNAEALENIKKLCEEKGAEVSVFLGDLKQPEICEALLCEASDKLGKLDVLINNAGISHVELIQDSSEENLQEILSANLSSMIRLSKGAVRMMLPHKSGRIINISSVYGIYGASCEAEYSATKGAVNAFTKALAKELAPSGIAVNAVAPGAIDTEMNGHLSQEEKEALREEIPAGRMGTPEEVAELTAFLTEAPLYLTGDIIEIAGGWF